MCDDKVQSQLGRICSNSFEFRNFEFEMSNSNVECSRIRPILSNSTKFDLELVEFDQIRPCLGHF